MPKKEDKPDFESSLQKLEGIVRELESGEKGLEESLELFEKGVTLAKGLTTQLEDAKRKVEVLTKEGGKLARKPFAEAAGLSTRPQGPGSKSPSRCRNLTTDCAWTPIWPRVCTVTRAARSSAS